MLIAITCTDKPNHLEKRLEVRPRHLDWLKENLPEGAFVGPLLDDDNETFKGSLYILDFESLDAARAWIAEEPYFKADLFESVVMRLTRNILPLV